MLVGARSSLLLGAGVVNAAHFLRGDGSDETAALTALLQVARGRSIHFPTPPDAYMVSAKVKVYAGTELYGDGAECLFEQSGNMEPLFDCIDQAGVSIHDLKGVYTGGVSNATSTKRGGAAMATCALVWTNADDGTFTDLESEDFGVCVRVDNWDGATRTARCAGLTVARLTCVRPNFGVLVSGCSDSTFTTISASDMQHDLPDALPHAVYFTDEGVDAPYMSGLTISDLAADGCPDSAFSFKALDGGTVDGMVAEDCTALFTARDCTHTIFTGGDGTALTGDVSIGGLYTEHCTHLTIDDMTLRFVVNPAGDSETPGRGVVLIGDDLTVTGLDIEFPQDDNPNAACVVIGAIDYDTDGYALTDCTIVNTGTTAGYAAAIRNAAGVSLTGSVVSGFPNGHQDTGTTTGVVWNP